LKILTEKRQFLRIARKLCATFVAQIGNSAPYARVVSEADGGGVVKSIKSMPNPRSRRSLWRRRMDPRSSRCDSLSTLLRMTCPHSRACRFDIQNSAPARKRDRGGWSPSCNATRVTEGVIGKNKGNTVKTFFSSLLIVFVTIFVAPAFAALPAGYIELEYIESTGTQYITTSLTTNDGDISVQAVYEPASFSVSEDYAVIFGVNLNFQAGYNSTGHAYIGNAASRGALFSLNTKATINAVLSTVSSRGTYFVNGADTGLKRQLDASSAVWLFAANSSGYPRFYARGKMYKFVAIRNDSTIMNLVPARRDSDGVLGMYDLADSNPSTAFHTNQGSGTFTAGPVAGIHIATTAYNSARFSPVVTDLNDTIATIRSVVTNTINQTAAIADLQATKQTRPEDACPAGKKCLLVETEENGVIVPHWFPIIENIYGLPAGYTALEYIESTGGGAYIRLNGYATNDTSFDMIVTRKCTESAKGLYGAASSGSWPLGSGIETGANQEVYLLSGGEQLLDNFITIGTEVHIVQNKNVYTATDVNGTRTRTQPGGEFQTSYPVMVGAITAHGYTRPCDSVWKYFNVSGMVDSDGNVLPDVKLIPAQNASGVIGMYDTVGNVFYTNRGTGTFTAGPVVQ